MRQENGTDAAGKSTSRNQADQGAFGLWPEKMYAWNKAFGEALVAPALDAYAAMLSDYRDVMTSTTEQIHENMELVRQGVHDLSRAEAPADYMKASAALRDKLTKQQAKAGRTFMTMAGGIASRRLRASTALAATVIEKSKLKS